jgi:Superinfection immunity protein
MDNLEAWSVILGGYFAPTILCLFNGKATWNDAGHLFMLNLLFGWTGIGWFLLVMLATVDFKQRHINRQAKQAEANFYLREEARYRATQAPR